MNDPSHGLALPALPPFWEPIPERPLPATITGLEHVAETPGVGRGAGIATFGSLAFVPAWSGNTRVVDIADPENPGVLSVIPGSARDADIIAYPDGRLVLALATDRVVRLWDVTDPVNPTRVTTLYPDGGSHNIGVVPGTPILFNANNDGDRNLLNQGRFPALATGTTEIYDLSDPAHPVERVWRNGYGCHDVTFHVDPVNEKYRAYCAGKQVTQIWDIADPWNPEVVVNVPVHHGVPAAPSAEVRLVFFSHLAMVNHDASVLIVGDETGGGIAAGCDAHADAGVASTSGPTGNLWFYDLTDEQNPVLRSWISPTSALVTDLSAGACTMHFGRLVEDRDMLVVGAYAQGTQLVDFSNLLRPFIVDAHDNGSDTWDAWYYNGWVFTGDLARGLDVLTFR